MNPSTTGKALALLGACSLLGGCETISSWFPDKQKQYKYSTEIPSLEIPPDLTASTIDDANIRRLSEPAPEEVGRSAERDTGEASSEEQEQEGVQPAGEEAPKSALRKTKTPGVETTLAQSSDNVPLVEIEAPFDRAWSEVAKALGRLELEVTDQNRSDGVYFVYYGGDQKPYEDRGFFGDVAEMFGSGVENTKEYRVKLEDKGPTTLLYVLDSEEKPQASGPGFDLLKRLHETLQNLSKPDKDAKPKPED
jgi:outer membrane protein assembly factor BamC